MEVLHSMTGFGRAAVRRGEVRAEVEVRTLNHRYLDVQIRCDRRHAALEERLRRLASQRVRRGRVEIHVLLEDFSEAARTVTVDLKLLEGYLQAFEEARRLVPVESEWDPEALLAIPGLFVVHESPPDVDRLWPPLEEALSAAFDAVLAARRAEGAALQADLEAKAQSVEELLAAVAERAPAARAAYRARLERRLAELDAGAADPVRLAQETLIFAERSDIEEELVRSRKHLLTFKETLKRTVPSGRKLDFLLQELFREANTIGSKSQDAQIGAAVVELKELLEQMREQVQNIE